MAQIEYEIYINAKGNVRIADDIGNGCTVCSGCIRLFPTPSADEVKIVRLEGNRCEFLVDKCVICSVTLF